jgi:hypothetical protein
MNPPQMPADVDVDQLIGPKITVCTRPGGSVGISRRMQIYRLHYVRMERVY